MPSTLEDTEQQQNPVASSAEPEIEVTINTKPTEPPPTDKEDTPELKRSETVESIYTDNAEFVQRGAPRPFDSYDEFVPPPRLPRLPRTARRIPPPPRRYNYSPSPLRRAPVFISTPLLGSSTLLLEYINYDGVVDLPFPGKSSIYLTTFPFSDKDVKEWTWLFRSGIEDKFLHKRADLADADDESEDEWFDNRRGRANRRIHIHHGRRDRSPLFDNTADIPSVYLSRALDPAVIPEPSEEFTYMIVVKNRARSGGGAKLLTAGSRKAAGITIYYEALIGNSVVFVGAVKGGGEKGMKAHKYERMASMDEAATEGVVGMIC